MNAVIYEVGYSVKNEMVFLERSGRSYFKHEQDKRKNDKISETNHSRRKTLR